MVKEFNNWFSMAVKAKCRRNNYVHGRWPVVFFRGAKNIRFEPQFGSKSSMEEFSMKEFKAIVSEINKIHKLFHNLREKYLYRYEFCRKQEQ